MNEPLRTSIRLRLMTGLYLVRGDEILLLWKTSGRVVKELWCPSAGGHFERDEINDPLSCVLRELKEETGLAPDSLLNLSLRYVTVRAAQEELRQNFYYFAELVPEMDKSLTSTEGVLRWFREEETRDLPMPHTSRAVLRH